MGIYLYQIILILNYFCTKIIFVLMEITYKSGKSCHMQQLYQYIVAAYVLYMDKPSNFAFSIVYITQAFYKNQTMDIHI